MKDFLKRELTSASTLIGLAIAGFGNLLPFLTPQTLTDLGVPSKLIPRISSCLGLLLVLYRQKPKDPPEATRVPFVPSSPEKKP